MQGDIYLEDLNQYEKAVDYFTQAMALDPLNPVYREKRGKAFELMGVPEKAAEDRLEGARLVEAAAKG